EPLRVGVEVLPAGQLSADGDDFDLHAELRWSEVGAANRAAPVFALSPCGRGEPSAARRVRGKLNGWGELDPSPGRLRRPPSPARGEGEESARLGKAASEKTRRMWSCSKRRVTLWRRHYENNLLARCRRGCGRGRGDRLRGSLG